MNRKSVRTSHRATLPHGMQRPFPLRPTCSAAVLWAAGVLACLPAAAGAQVAGSVLPATTLPLPRLNGVVSGQAVINRPVTSGAGSLLTIDQTSSRAVIDWKSFNIGSASEVRFNHPGTTASTLNRIYSADPSIVQGKLGSAGPVDPKTGQAGPGGQIILINQNGILFDRGAQVNAYSLVASTLNLSNEFFLRGLLSGDDVSRPVPAFTGGYRLDGDGSTDAGIRPSGAIVLGAGGPGGATAPTITTPAGGNVLIFAPVIDNRSAVMSAPDGQVILAAGSKVYLGAQQAAAEGVRGFLVEVSAADADVNLSSLIRNQGEISADRGNVTLAGLAINQEGRVSASTAVLYNGSVWLKATSKEAVVDGGPLVPARAGTVTLGANSLTATPLDTTDRTTLAESQAYASSVPADDRRGRVSIEGRTVVHQGRIETPGGLVSVQAGSPVAGETGRIYLAERSRIDASGHWADVDHESNFVTFRVTSTELKDAPDQKNGILKGATVTMDLRRGSSILDLSGYVEGRRRTVAEKAADGGTVELASTGDLIQRPGAVLDVSGGGFRHAAGTSNTTRLLGDDGRVYDLATAPQQRQFTAQLDRFTQTDERWGQTRVYEGPLGTQGRAEAAYVEGRRGGSLSLSAPNGLVLDGTLSGGATTGPTQLDKAPAGATLTLGSDLNRTNTAVAVPSVRFTNVWRDTLGPTFTPLSPLTASAASRLDLAAQTLFPRDDQAGDVGGQDALRFSQIELNSRGLVELPAGVALEAGTGNTLLLRGHEIDIGGRISAPAGQVVLQTRPVPASEPTPDAERVTVRSGASVSVAGLWLNNSRPDATTAGPALPSATLAADAAVARPTTQGGSISVSAGRFDMQLGSTLDVSGGGALAPGGRIAAGSGGSIALHADRLAETGFDRAAGDLLGYSLGTGGSLALITGRAQIGGLRAVADDVMRLDAAFFTEGGFSAYSVAAAQGLAIVSGTTLAPKVESWTVKAEEAAALRSGAALSDVAAREVLPAHQRPAASLTLSASGSPLGNAVLSLQPGASISTDPGAKVTLDAVNGLNVDGRVSAPGGAITLSLRGSAATAPVLSLGEKAELLAAGTFIATPDDGGLRQGKVWAGGTVTMSAARGSIVASEGSRIDVGGTAQTLDFASTDPTSAAPTSKLIASDAGTLVLRSQERTSFGSQISAQPGGPGSAGGSFAMEFTNRPDRLLPSDASVDRRIIVTRAPSSLPAEAGVVDAAVDVNRLSGGGFDKIRLQSGGRIEFRGQTTLDFERAIQLDTPELRLVDGAGVRLDAASVVLANSFAGVLAPGLQGTTASRNNNLPSRSVATRPGDGRFEVRADTVDLIGDLTLNGAARTTLSSDHDLRLSGRVVGDPAAAAGAALVGSLVSEGDITLNAAQVYPTTGSSFTVAVQSRNAAGATRALGDGSIVVGTRGQERGAALSADGALTLRAHTITQGGVLVAPLGRLSLEAGGSLQLAAGSLTSVSADGLVLPYGTTLDQRQWVYGPTRSRADLNALTAPPGKRIDLTGPAVAIATGATVDLSGGGDIQAAEFVTGTGGSTDTLLKDNTFAILPTAMLSSMPVDREIAARKDLGLGLFTSRPDALAYDSLHIGTGSIVPPGDYVLLPGRYALLPGAYMVTLQTGSTYARLQPGQTATLPNGQVVVPGHRAVAGTAIRESQTIGVVVRPGSSARLESDYALADASFFADRADVLRTPVPPLPGDGGRLAVAAGTALALDGNLKVGAATPGSRAATVDISSPKIAVVDDAGSTVVDASYLKLDAGLLSRVGGSLLLGGTRTDTADGVRLTASASEVVFANAREALLAPELLVAATDRIDVRTGSVLRGEGTAIDGAGTLTADRSGALMRLASGTAQDIARAGAPGTERGIVTVAAGATLGASGSMAIDGTRSVRTEGRFEIGQNGALALSAASMTLGSGSSVAPGDGLVLGDTVLRSFDQFGSLTLKAYGDMSFATGAIVGAPSLGHLVLDAPRLRSAGSGDATALAQHMTLQNSGAAPAASAQGTGTLELKAETITLGTGTKAIDNFGRLVMRATGEIVASGTGAMNVAAATTLEAPRIVGRAGADQALRSVTEGPTPQSFALALARPVGAAPTATPAPSAATQEEAGGRLRLEGESVRLDTTVAMKSGAVTLAALGTGTADEVRLGAQAVIDVSAFSREFGGRPAIADAGSIALRAAVGDVVAEAGSTLQLSGAASGGHAGRLQIAGRTASLEGTIAAQASAKAEGGRVSVDVERLADFSALNSALGAAGFDAAQAVRVRTGDLQVAATDSVKARSIQLQADGGRIVVDGRLDASSVGGGGRIELHAGTGLRLAGQVVASGTSQDAGSGAAPSDGGVFSADTRSGSLSMGSLATVDVRPGAKGEPGRAVFTAARDADGGVDVALQGTVLTRRGENATAGEVIVQGRRIETGVSEVTPERISQWALDHAAFMGQADVGRLTGALQGDGTRHVRGLLELQTTGNFTMGTPWDLTTAPWLQGSGSQATEPGTLVIRAAGDVTVRRELGNLDDRLLAVKTWSIGMASGADLSAAHPLTTQAPALLGRRGNFTMAAADAPLLAEQLYPDGRPSIDPSTEQPTLVAVDQAAKIRTGTGDIAIAAGRDFVFAPGALPAEDAKRVIVTTGRLAAPQDASPMTIGIDSPWATGGGDISILAQHDAIGQSNPWVNEWLRRPRGSVAESGVGGWFVYRPNFQHQVGTLGGGDITIAAGQDVLNLSAAAPTMGRVVTGAGGPTLQVTGGGNVRVEAGNRIEGGEYLVARGTGRLQAGGAVGAAAPTQVYLMGQSDDPARQGATMSIAAGGAVRLQSVDNPTILEVTTSRALGPQQFVAELGADGQPLRNEETGEIFYLPVPAQNFQDSTQGARSHFFTYADNSALDVRALGGNVTLGARPARNPTLGLAGDQALIEQSASTGSAYPGIVNVTAFSGDIVGAADRPQLTLFPTPRSELSLLASGHIGTLNVSVSSLAPAGIADWSSPSLASSGWLATGANSPRQVLAAWAQGLRYDVVADTGNITAFSLETPDRTRVQAGLDMVGVSLALQNQRADDVSVVRALRGDVRPNNLSMAGPGRLVVQAGRNIDLGANVMQALGNSRNSSLSTGNSARLTFIAGFVGNVDLAVLENSFGEFVALNKVLDQALALYKLLNEERDDQRVLSAGTVADLAARNPAYQPYVALGEKHPTILGVYQNGLRSGRLPLGSRPDATAALALFTALNAESDEARLKTILSAASLEALASDPAYAARYQAFAELGKRYPALFADYQVRRGNGFLPSSVLPIVYGDVLDESIAKVFPSASVSRGNIDSFLTSIQTIGGSGIDLFAPGGDITVGLTTPRSDRDVGVITTGGGDIRSMLSGNFNINQGKVVTAQGGDIVLFTSKGNIDAGRGARTSQTSPAPIREPIVENGVVVGFISKIPAGFSGSGIQTLSSDPDGQGLLPAAIAGAVLLFTPAGYVDAGEAGIVSGGDLVIVAQTVLNAANITAQGASTGVPQGASGSLASALASSGTTTAGGSKAAEDAANAAATATRTASAPAAAVKPTILSVEVLGFGDRNCREDDKDCFAK